MGAFLLALVVGVFSASPFGERDVAYAQTQDDDRLRSLSITGVSLSPVFNKDTTTYSARVPTGKATVQVRATANNNNAKVAVGRLPTIDDNDPNTIDDTNTITTEPPLTLGGPGETTVITVQVASETEIIGNMISADTVKVYTISVYRLAVEPSNDATLTSWELREGAGIEGLDLFANPVVSVATSDNPNANVKVSHDVEKVTLVASATHLGAIVQVGNVRYNQSITSRELDLNGKGSKTVIRLIVTPENGTSSESYSITVYRERAVLSSDNNLRSLSLGSGITLMPSFSSSKTKYTARVRNSVDHATVTSTLSDQAGGASASRTAPNPADSETPDSRPASGDQVELTAGAETTITVTVTAEDGSEKPYEVVLYRENYKKSDIKTLNALTVRPGTVPSATEVTLGPSVFVPDLSSPDMFTAKVPNEDSSVTVMATPTHIGAMHSITPADASSGSMGHQVNLTAGAVTTITVTVTAEGGSTQDYTINVYRSASTDSNDNTLKSLTVTGLNGAGGSTTQIFTPTIPRLVNNAAIINVRVRTTTSHVKIEATGHPSAGVTIPTEAAGNGQSIDEGMAEDILVVVNPENSDADSESRCS